MRRVLDASLIVVAVAAVFTTVMAVPASAGQPRSLDDASTIPACSSITAGPTSSNVDPAGWDFSGSTAGGEHSFVPGGLHLASSAGATSSGQLALDSALSLAAVGEPGMEITSAAGNPPLLGLQVQVDGSAAGVLQNDGGDQWWDDQALPGVSAGDHAADGTLDEILADVTDAGSTIAVSGIQYTLTASSTPATATLESITVGCTEYEFTAVEPAASISGTAAVGRTVTADASGWTPVPVNVSYRWSVAGSVVSSAATYTIKAADRGKKLSLTVTASGPGYTDVQATAGPVTVKAGTLSAATPTIKGAVRVGSKVTVSSGTWKPSAALSYQWRVDGVAVRGATASSYTIPAAYVGRKLSVTATGTRDGYARIGKTSAAVTVASGQFSAPAPKISGSARVGVVVKVVPGAWSPTAKLAYRWRVDGVAVKGATGSSYTVKAADRGKRLSVSVTGSRSGYATVTRTSSSVAVAAGKFTSEVPKISGTVQVGSRVTVKRGTWSPGPSKVSYRWRVNGVAVKGATGSSYTVKAADRGKRLSVSVTGSRSGYATRTVTSAAHTVTMPFAKTHSPSITGVHRVGSKLTAHVAAWSPKASLSFRWKRNGVPIAGATRSTYVLTVADHGRHITVTVTGKRSGFTPRGRTSGATGAIGWPVGVSKPSIKKQPSSSRPATGSVAKMSVSAAGGRLHYQWQYSADNKHWKGLKGKTSATLSFRAISAKTGFYRVHVTNMIGGKYSRSVVVMVRSSRADPYGTGKTFLLNNWGAAVGSSYATYDDYGTSVVAAPVFVTYVGDGSSDAWLDLDVEYIGSNGVVYDDLDVYGFYDSDIWSTNEVYSGAGVSFIAYAAVPTWAIPGGVWRITDDSDWSNTSVQYVKGR